MERIRIFRLEWPRKFANLAPKFKQGILNSWTGRKCQTRLRTSKLICVFFNIEIHDEKLFLRNRLPWFEARIPAVPARIFPNPNPKSRIRIRNLCRWNTFSQKGVTQMSSEFFFNSLIMKSQYIIYVHNTVCTVKLIYPGWKSPPPSPPKLLSLFTIRTLYVHRLFIHSSWPKF